MLDVGHAVQPDPIRSASCFCVIATDRATPEADTPAPARPCEPCAPRLRRDRQDARRASARDSLPSCSPTFQLVQMGREAVVGDRDVDPVSGLPYSAKRRRSGPGRSSRVTRSPPVAASPPSSKPSRTPTGPPPLHLWRVSHVGIPPGRPLLTRLTVARIPRVPHQKSRCERPLAERRYDVTVTPTRVRPTVRSVPGRRG